MTRQLQLAILADGDDHRIFVLTDGQGLALQARTTGGPARLPPAVQAALGAGADGGALRLVLDPALAGLDWESQALGARWATSRQLLAADSTAAMPAPMPAPLPPPLPAARPDDVRQLTVLACDLVDSTGLMHRLGDEEYSERLLRYHQRVAAIARRYSGLADDPQGDDGFMCYFGHPVAQEDAAAQAIRAGLALSNAVADLGLQLRIGISTGPVVIRDGQPVGAVIHHAARLQSVAGAGAVLVGAAARRIAAERFDFCAVELAAPLKGFGDSGAVFRVQRERPALGTERFDHRPDLTQFVGRDAPLQALFGHWRTVTGGQRQAVLLRGEAGMGKSRLVREFVQALAAQGHRTLECHCAPEHAGSAFQPLIDLMRRRLQVHEGDEPSVQLQRLRALQITSGPQADQALALLGTLLSLPAEVLPALPAPDAPERRRQLTMALLERVALGLADQAPVCLILEDVHWIDPSTRALMQRLIEGPPGQRVLLLLTQRASAAEPPAWGQPALATLALAGLDAAATRQLLQGASGGALADEALLDWLAARADGVPLFIEESARMAAALARRHPTVDVARSLRERVPGSLRDLLAARLDQWPGARGAAQVGAALGRHFSGALIEAVCADPGWALPGAALGDQLQALVDAGLLTVQPEGGQTVYAFAHALLRDAAHQSLLARDRRRLHGVVAGVLQAQFAPLCQAQPELLAWHQEQAGETTAALAAWEQAARRATARSAHHEAQGHLHRALALLAENAADDSGAPANGGEPRLATELRLQLLLAGRLMATAGYGAAPLAAVYQRISVLAEARRDAGALHRARLGLEGFHFMRADFARAAELADALVAGLGANPEPMVWLQAHWAQANLRFHTGQVPQALALADHCLAGWAERAAAVPARSALLQHPAVMCHSYAAWALWALGRADAALARARQAVALAEQLQHPFSLGQALGFLAVAHHFRGETAAGLQAAERAVAVCEAGGFAVWLAHACMLRGRLRASQGDVAGGLADITRGHAAWLASGAQVTLPFYRGLLAECLALDHRPAEALALVDEALAQVHRQGERHCAPDLHCLRGALLLQVGGAGAPALAQACWQAGLAEARAMQLPGLALRCATAMARHWAAQGHRVEAIALLAPLLPVVAAGGASPDTVQAEAVWAALAQ